MRFHSAQGSFTVPVETPVDLVALIGDVISSNECATLLVSKFGFTETEACTVMDELLKDIRASL